jgi:GNAT superfamily N-acetyltransferase
MTMEAQVKRVVRAEELERLLPVVEQFYAHFGFVWDAGKKRELLEGFLQRTEAGRLWLAEVDGVVVGYALVPFYFALEFDGPVALLDEFFVRPEARGQGVGAKLLEGMVTALQSEGIRRVRLEVDERHPEAAELYERLGFTKDGRETWSKGA